MARPSVFDDNSTNRTTGAQDLMLAAGGGDLQAFAEIVRRHQRQAWSIAYRFLGQAEEAEDVVQDAFLKILAAAPRYRPTASFSTFLYRVVTRVCLDRVRKRRPVYMDTPPDSPAPGLTASEGMAAEERQKAVRAALAVLPPNQRMAIILRYYEDLGYREMAEALDVSEKAAERLLARARKTLRGILPDRLE